MGAKKGACKNWGTKKGCNVSKVRNYVDKKASKVRLHTRKMSFTLLCCITVSYGISLLGFLLSRKLQTSLRYPFFPENGHFWTSSHFIFWQAGSLGRSVLPSPEAWEVQEISWHDFENVSIHVKRRRRKKKKRQFFPRSQVDKRVMHLSRFFPPLLQEISWSKLPGCFGKRNWVRSLSFPFKIWCLMHIQGCHR